MVKVAWHANWRPPAAVLRPTCAGAALLAVQTAELPPQPALCGQPCLVKSRR